MKGVRILGLVFSGIFALGCGLIGFALTRVYFQLPVFKVIDRPFAGYDITAAIGFAAVGALIGFLLGSILYRRIVDIGQSLRRIPAEDKIAALSIRPMTARPHM